MNTGADERSRTSDLLITNQLLYQLSYISEGAILAKIQQVMNIPHRHIIVYFRATPRDESAIHLKFVLRLQSFAHCPEAKKDQSSAMNPSETARGIGLSVTASMLFALLSAYTSRLAPLDGLDIFAWRILWTLPFSLVLLVRRRQHKQMLDAVRTLPMQPVQALLFVMMTAILGVQLWLFLWAPVNGRALDVSLGYFLLPLTMVLVGCLIYRERLDGWQRLAVVCTLAGVLHEWWVMRSFSWPTVLVALGYPPYFMMRRRLTLNSLVIFTMELILLTPAALYALSLSPHLSGVWQRPALGLLLLPGLGLLSTIALDCFLRASRLLPMGLFGILGYVEPTLLVVVAIFLLGETLPQAQLLTYIPIWISVGFTAVHSVRMIQRE